MGATTGEQEAEPGEQSVGPPVGTRLAAFDGPARRDRPVVGVQDRRDRQQHLLHARRLRVREVAGSSHHLFGEDGQPLGQPETFQRRRGCVLDEVHERRRRRHPAVQPRTRRLQRVARIQLLQRAKLVAPPVEPTRGDEHSRGAREFAQHPVATCGVRKPPDGRLVAAGRTVEVLVVGGSRAAGQEAVAQHLEGLGHALHGAGLGRRDHPDGHLRRLKTVSWIPAVVIHLKLLRCVPA